MRNEINEKLARLAGYKLTYDNPTHTLQIINEQGYCDEIPDYCEDLNLLTRLTLKNGINPMQFLEKDNPKKAIIECLLKIAEEGLCYTIQKWK